MGQILKSANDSTPLNKNGNMNVPAMLLPSFRTLYAIEQKLDKNFLIRSFGGLGDQVCAEPAIRYAINHFKDCRISVLSLTPELFQHLPIEDNFHELKGPQPELDKYFCFQSMYDPDHLNWEFFCHMIVHCVDFCSLNMWRCQMPIQERNIILVPNQQQEVIAQSVNPETDVVIHAGRNWQSKTFPKEFWDQVIARIIQKGKRPILIGHDVLDGKAGTVDVDNHGCIDLRNMLSVMQTVAILQKSRVLLTNDSSPLHLAASGHAWIGFISTVKHPDFITHYRENLDRVVEFGWRMKNFSSGGMWETLNLNPNNTHEVFFNQVDPNQLANWLPDPDQYAEWAVEKLSDGV